MASTMPASGKGSRKPAKQASAASAPMRSQRTGRGECRARCPHTSGETMRVPYHRDITPLIAAADRPRSCSHKGKYGENAPSAAR